MISEGQISQEENFDLTRAFFQVNPEFKGQVRFKRIKFALKSKQYKELLKVAYAQNFKHGLMIETQLFTGIRVNELVNLSVPQIFGQYIFIRSRKATKYVGAFMTKSIHSNRRILIPKKLAEKLRAYIGTRKNGYVFKSNKGGHLLKNTVIGSINKYAKQCKSIGHNIGSHALRRTYASYLLQAGIVIGDISKLLGHASIRTTMIYLYDLEQIDEAKIQKALNKMLR